MDALKLRILLDRADGLRLRRAEGEVGQSITNTVALRRPTHPDRVAGCEGSDPRVAGVPSQDTDAGNATFNAREGERDNLVPALVTQSDHVRPEDIQFLGLNQMLYG